MKDVASNHRGPRWLASTALVASVSAIALMAGCASAPPPMEQLAVSRSSVERASGSAAEAPAELAMARDKLARANQAYANKDYVLARQLSEQADADAALAEAQARSVRSGKALAAVRDGIRQLREEMTRNSS